MTCKTAPLCPPDGCERHDCCVDRPAWSGAGPIVVMCTCYAVTGGKRARNPTCPMHREAPALSPTQREDA